MLLPHYLLATSWLALGSLAVMVPQLAVIILGSPAASILSYAMLGLACYALASVAVMLAWYYRSLRPASAPAPAAAPRAAAAT